MADLFYTLDGSDSIVKDLIFNNSADEDGDIKTYRGAFVKVKDWDDHGTGVYICTVAEGTVSENLIGIIMEEVAATGETYLLDSATTTENWVRKKILVNPNAVFLVEYSQKDAAGTSNLEDGIVIAAAGTESTTCPSPADDDSFNGGWIYPTNGSAEAELHFVLQSKSSTTNGIEALRTAMVNAIATGDDHVCINPPFDYRYDLDATLVNFKSQLETGSRTDRFIGIDYWMKAPGFPMQKLTASIHDGLVIDNARFFHEVMISNHYLGGYQVIS